MRMSEFVAKVLNEIRSLPENQTGTHPLVDLESRLEYKKLEGFLLKYSECNDPVSLHMDEFKKILKIRFFEKLKMLSSYQINPYSKINFSYVILARQLAPYAQLPVYNLLMPSVEFDKRFLSLMPHEFILIKRKQLIPVCVVDYLDGLKFAIGSRQPGRLSASESRLFIHHSDEARRYTHAILIHQDEALRRKELVSAIKSRDYQVKADFGEKGEERLALSILPQINTWPELLTILSKYIPRHDWQRCFDFINNENLFKAILNVEFNKLDLNENEIEHSFIALSCDLQERFQLLGAFLASLKQNEKKLNALKRNIPDLLRIVSTFNLAEMFASTNYQMAEFKKRLLDKMNDVLLGLPPHAFDDQMAFYASQSELIDAVFYVIANQKWMNTFKRLSSSALFMLVMTMDMEKYKKSLRENIRQLSQSELIITEFYDAFLHSSLCKNEWICSDDSYIRLYFLLLSEIYKRQRDFKGDSYLSSVNRKANKIQGCELFQHFLLSEYPLHDYYVYPLSDALLNDNDLAALWVPITSGILGKVTKNAFRLGEMLYHYGVIPDEIEYQAKDKQDCLSLNRPIMNKPANINDLINHLVHDLPQEEWQQAVSNIDLMTWMRIVVNVNAALIKSRCENNPMTFQRFFWSEFDVNFRKLLKQDTSYTTMMDIRAYLFCLAFTYKRQREKRGDYSSQIARTASRLNIMSAYSAHSKKDKILACDALINYILSEDADFSERHLRAYLRANYLPVADKYTDILKSDTLGELVYRLYKCGYQLLEEHKEYKYRS